MISVIFNTDTTMRLDLLVLFTLVGIYLYLEYRAMKKASVSANTKAKNKNNL